MNRIIFIALVSIVLLSSCRSRVVVTEPQSVTVVKKLPRSYKVVKVKGHRYYYFNGRHYKKTRKGYVVVRV